MTITNRNIIIFSSIDWSVHWQLHHQLTTSLISSGNRVLFVDNTGIRSVNVSDASRIKERALNWYKGAHGFSQIKKNLTIYSPLLLPFPYSKIPLFVNKIIFTKTLLRWVSASNFNKPIVISFLPTPLTQYVITRIKPALQVYYCANNMANSSDSASQVKPHEDLFFKKSDVVLTAAYVIQEYAQRLSDKVYYFPPGIDFEKFQIARELNDIRCADMSDIPTPIIGFIGAIGHAFDQEMVVNLAEQCPDISIVLIGPAYEDITYLKDKKNVFLLGVKSHDQLPYYIKQFDVGIIPYLCNEFTTGVYPSKLNEYLAMGIPVVSTGLKEVKIFEERFQNTVIVADTEKDFVNAIKVSLNKHDASLKDARIKVAELNSWNSRFDGISSILKKELTGKERVEEESYWQQSFSSLFKKDMLKRKVVAFFALVYLLVFYTPLFWFLGDFLIIENQPKVSDAIVVFSGDGEVGYFNSSYQKRAKDAVYYYKKGLSNKIILSSGRRQTIKDSELMRLFLIDSGVPKTSIYILDSYPDSTYGNVMAAKKVLSENGISSILFLTSPYHSLRSVLLWGANAPNIRVTTPKSNINSGNVKNTVNMDDVRIILYEYTSILYNWLRGRI